MYRREAAGTPGPPGGRMKTCVMQQVVLDLAGPTAP